MADPLRLCVDIDNVVALSDVSIRALIAAHTNGRVNLQYRDVRNFDYAECEDAAGGRIDRAAWNAIHRAFSEPENLASLNALEAAHASLHALAVKYEIHYVTSRLPGTQTATERWLCRKGLPIHQLHFATHREKHLIPIKFSAVIEDDYDQGVEFARLGIRTCLIEHPWNVGRPGVPNLDWYFGWPEVTADLLAATTGA